MASPTPNLPNDSPEEQDRRYNPGEQINQEKMNSGFSGVSADSGEEADSPESVREKEENPETPNTIPYEQTSTPGKRGPKQPLTLKGVFKKRGPMALIATILFGGGGLLSFMFTPALGLVNFKEVLMGDLNDQLSAYSLRSDAMLRTKIDQRTSGFCSNSIKIRCQFSTMSTKQVERFRQAGFVIEEGDVNKTLFGRERITRMTTPNGQEIRNPQDLRNLARDPAGRNLMLRAFNPAYMALSDAVANNTFRKLGISKASWFDPKKGAEESARAVTSGEANSGRAVIDVDEDGRQYITDPDSDATPPDNRIYADVDEDRFNQVVDEAERLNTEFDEKANELPGKAVGGVLSGAIKGASIVGIADVACTTYNLARAVAAAAKTARALQLAQFSMLYLNTADSIRAGTATPEEVEYLGTKLAEVDTAQFIIDETQPYTGNATTDAAAFSSLEPTPNPTFGQSGYDAPGYKIPAYNEAPTLSARSLQYTVGGGLTGTFSGVTDSIAASLGVNGAEGIRNTCGVIQSWWVRGVGLAIGVVAALGTGGASVLISVGGSIAVSAALPFLEAALTDVLAGQVVNEDTDSLDAADATFAGTAVINGSVAQARGLSPLDEQGLEEYMAISNEVENEYIAAARFEAKDTPLDIINQYSFLGSFARSLYPSMSQAGSSVRGTLAAIPDVLTASVASIFPTASAMMPYNPDRFIKCSDPGYDELGIKADVFCNVRYGLSREELSLDTIGVLEYMLNGDHIDSAGLPRSTEYKEFLQYCVNREDGWGETGEEGTPDMLYKMTGKMCMEKNSQISNFRVFTLDKSIADAMDETEATAAFSTFDIASPVSETARVTSKFGPRSCNGCSKWHQGIDIVSSDQAVFSIMDGEVTNITRGGFNNNVVTIRHADGLMSTYWHMRLSDIDSFIAVGDSVTAGQQIGIMGDEGQSYGEHLHIELNIANVENRAEYEERYIISTGGSARGNRIDPLDFFEKNGVPGFVPRSIDA